MRTCEAAGHLGCRTRRADSLEAGRATPGAADAATGAANEQDRRQALAIVRLRPPGRATDAVSEWTLRVLERLDDPMSLARPSHGSTPGGDMGLSRQGLRRAIQLRKER